MAKTYKKTNTKCFQDPIYAIFFISRGFKDLKYYIGCFLVMTQTKTKTQFYAFSGVNIFQGWIFFKCEYFPGVTIFFRVEYFLELNIFQEWMFSEANIFLGESFRGWIFFRITIFQGWTFFQGWMFFRGKYFLSVYIFQG